MTDNQYAPLVLFVYNRPEHTKQVLDSVNNQPETKNTKLIIYADNAKNEAAVQKVEQTRRLIEEFAENESNFASVEIRKAEKNQGLAKACISGITDVVNEYGEVIMLEDDDVVSPDFLDYMNRGLDCYRDCKNIWSISGYTFPMSCLDDYPYDVWLCGRADSWGFATWKDRWNTVDWQVSDYPAFKFNFKKRAKLAHWGPDMPTMLDAQMLGEINSWSIRWCYAAIMQDKYCISPKISRVYNIGFDGSGTHCRETGRYDTLINSENKKCEFCMPELNETIRKQYCAHEKQDFLRKGYAFVRLFLGHTKVYDLALKLKKKYVG